MAPRSGPTGCSPGRRAVAGYIAKPMLRQFPFLLCAENHQRLAPAILPLQENTIARWQYDKVEPFKRCTTAPPGGGAVMALLDKEQPSMSPRQAPHGKSLLRKRSVRLYGHNTSLTLEDAFWAALKEIAAAQGTTIVGLIVTIDSERRERQCLNLSSAIRLFILDYYRRMRP